MLTRCNRCGHTWIKRKTNPICCPKCKTPYWNKKRTIKKNTFFNKKSMRMD